MRGNNPAMTKFVVTWVVGRCALCVLSIFLPRK
jgi:hypothetical protein